MSKILLVYPSLCEEGIKSSFAMPIGLIHVGSMLEHHNHEVKILDRNITSSNDYLKLLLKKEYDFVGIGSLTGKMLLDALEVSKVVKENSNSIVIWGSYHPTILPKQTLKNQFIDYIIQGEGEETFLKIADLHDRKQSFSKLNGVNLNPPAQSIDINKLPMPNYDLVDVKAYDTFYISTSRGCPYRCTFCHNWYDSYKELSADNTIKLFEFLTAKYKLRNVTVTDDNFSSNKKRLNKVANSIEKLDLKMYTFGRANYCDIETLKVLKKVGVWTINIGIESGSQKILNFLNKATTVKMNSDAIKNCRKMKILSNSNFMIGIPTETIEDLNLTLKFANLNKADSGGVSIFHPFPKTKVWDYCIKRNLVKELQTIEEWASHYDFNDVDMNVSDHSDEVLFDYYFKIQKVVSKGKYFRRSMLYLKSGRLPDYRRVLLALKNIQGENRRMKEFAKTTQGEKK